MSEVTSCVDKVFQFVSLQIWAAPVWSDPSFGFLVQVQGLSVVFLWRGLGLEGCHVMWAWGALSDSIKGDKNKIGSKTKVWTPTF